MTRTVLPSDATERKALPLVRGLLDYFPAACAAVAEVSLAGGLQHGHSADDLHWERGKSTDHADCVVRLLLERGTLDSDKLRHTAKVAWRALALLQEELEAAGAPLARGARPSVKQSTEVDERGIIQVWRDVTKELRNDDACAKSTGGKKT